MHLLVGRAESETAPHSALLVRDGGGAGLKAAALGAALRQCCVATLADSHMAPWAAVPRAAGTQPAL